MIYGSDLCSVLYCQQSTSKYWCMDGIDMEAVLAQNLLDEGGVLLHLVVCH